MSDGGKSDDEVTYVDINTPEGRLEDLGGAANPSDLAHLVVGPLREADRQGRPRPKYTPYAVEDETRRDETRELTPAERQDFDTALEQALNEATGS